MSAAALNDLGARIQACMAKHGLTERVMLTYRVRWMLADMSAGRWENQSCWHQSAVDFFNRNVLFALESSGYWRATSTISKAHGTSTTEAQS